MSTECGGEGRNFELCRRLVLFDLPWTPSIVEQRIGRRIPVDIVYFRPPGGIGADVMRVFEARSLFREPVAGLEPHLAHVEGALEAIALDPLASLSGEDLESLVSAPLTTWTQWNCARCHSIVPHKDWTCPVCGYTLMCRTVTAAVTWRSDAGSGSRALVRLLDVLRVQ